MFSPAKISSHRLSFWPPLAVLTVLSVGGCANPGPPRPPSLHLPALATGLKVERIGDETLLTWTTPDKTSDGLPNHESISAAVCREEPVKGKAAANSPICTAVSHLAVKPGESHTTDVLPGALTQEPLRLIVYRVELLNSRGRSAGLSAPAFAAAGAAPTDPGLIRVSATRSGAVIEWTPVTSDSGAKMTLTRTLVATEQGPVVASAAKPQKKPAAGLPTRSKPGSAAPVLLESPENVQTDPGGLTDRAVVPNDTYTYTAQRVRSVTLAGHPLELHSKPSAAVTFTYRDVFPPKPPTALEGIASAPLNGPASIDLSWEVSPDNGVLGYNVYREDAPSAGFLRLNAAPLPEPSYRDRNARLAHLYRYRVTAVDRSNNESKPSAEIEETIKAP